MTWAVGASLGPYELIAKIGEGGMGEVWKARDTRLDRIVAVKRLKSHSSRFEQEARAIAALNHPHICQIFDVGPDYLVLEYIEGRPLKGPLPPEEALRVALQVASALEEAHARGILHRDLKPANIMVTVKGSAKLLDFGLAKIGVDSRGEAATQTMAVMGTPAYMPPEQAEGRPADARSDVYSFGAVLYEALSGSRPFETLAAALRDDPRPLNAPAALTRAVMRCLAKQPADRFQTMAELRAALEGAGKQPAEAQPSIAVLPFANMSGDKEHEYFSDGLSEEIINALAQIPGLKVIARTSAFAFRGKELDIRKIAEALGVATILEGSVRRAGNRVRITAQLITAADGSHLWSQRYDREMEDVFAVQDEVAAEIAGVLQSKLAGKPASAPQHVPALPAYEAYLKARYHQWKLDPENMAKAKVYYEQAIALDPEFALAYVAYADLFLLRAASTGEPAHELIPLARENALKALAIDAGLPEVNAMLGIVAGIFDRDWKEAERRFRLALARDPVPAQVTFWYAWFFLLPMGRASAAAEEFRRVLQQDPLNLPVRYFHAGTLIAMSNRADAEAALRQMLDIEPAFFPAHGMLASLLGSEGLFEQALPYAEKAYALAPWHPACIGILAAVSKRTGNVGRAEDLIRRLTQAGEHRAAYGFYSFHMVLGETDPAAVWLEKMVEQRSSAPPGLLRFAQASLPSERWADVAKKLNLPIESDATRSAG